MLDINEMFVANEISSIDDDNKLFEKLVKLKTRKLSKSQKLSMSKESKIKKLANLKKIVKK